MEMELVSMLKAVMLDEALIRTFAIWVSLGTDEDANFTSAVLMIEPLLKKGNMCRILLYNFHLFE